MFASTSYPILDAEKELHLATLSPPYPPSPHSTDEWLRRLGTLPLINQPGEQWMYNTGAQVLGAVLERAAHSSATPKVGAIAWPRRSLAPALTTGRRLRMGRRRRHHVAIRRRR
ncbi:MAG: hypothetical protein ABI352_05530 [Candidatus Dormibacter sp.]